MVVPIVSGVLGVVIKSSSIRIDKLTNNWNNQSGNITKISKNTKMLSRWYYYYYYTINTNSISSIEQVYNNGTTTSERLPSQDLVETHQTKQTAFRHW